MNAAVERSASSASSLQTPPAQEAAPATSEVLIGRDAAVSGWRRTGVVASVAITVMACAVTYGWLTGRHATELPRYTSELVERGRLSVTVTANGSLQPTKKVDVGSELSGTVARVLVDVNDNVKKGQVLAELETSKLSDQVLRSRAAVVVARAKVEQVAATVEEARSRLARFQEVERLSGGKVPSQGELAAAKASLVRARADASSAQAGVVDASAALSLDETNLRNAAIRSPINGVVLARSVDAGNVLAAALQSVTLFTVAEDLTQLKLSVNVDEADVGQVHAGQKAQFTVSAYPHRTYPATISRVGLGSTTKDNAVTYVTELNVGNADLSLRPGMTATAVITATERSDVLLVPSAALRFTPAAVKGLVAANAGNEVGESPVAKPVPRMPQQGQRGLRANTSAVRQVWVLRDGNPEAVTVTTGLTDGRMTEVASDRLLPGMAVITDQVGGTKP